MSASSTTGAIPTAPYSTRPPSPPQINIPASYSNEPIRLVPNYANVDSAQLTIADLEIITQNGKEQISHDNSCSWEYSHRRKAQAILDYLYLGPSVAAKDKTWLQQEGISLLLAARDSRMAAGGLMKMDQVAKDLGIAAYHLDTSDNQELIRAFPGAVRVINDHMLQVYRQQAVNLSREGPNIDEKTMAIDQASFKRGKVLVFCESGNERSAAVITAYLMAVFGKTMVEAAQFVANQRFCVNITDELKHLLRSYEDLLQAQRSVSQVQHTLTPANAPPHQRVKRGVEDMMDLGESEEQVDAFALDSERYVGREQFTPFMDAD